MSTLGDLRGALRVVLADNCADGYLWSDQKLNRYLADAVRGYSRYFPRELSTSIAVVAGQGEYDLPAECEQVVRVEMSGAHGSTPLLKGGDTWSPEGGGSYEVYGGKLRLLPEPASGGETLEVRYLGSHVAPGSDSDACSVPGADEDLLLALAAAKALESLESDEAKRRLFERQSGQAVSPAAEMYRREWEEGVSVRRRKLRTANLVIR